MGSTEAQAEHPATSDEMTAALNAALEAGDLERIMGVMGRMARAHRMRRVARETGLGEKSLYKSMRAGASPSSTPSSGCSGPWVSNYRSIPSLPRKENGDHRQQEASS